MSGRETNEEVCLKRINLLLTYGSKLSEKELKGLYNTDKEGYGNLPFSKVFELYEEMQKKIKLQIPVPKVTEKEKNIDDHPSANKIISNLNTPTKNNKKSRKIAPKKNLFIVTKRSFQIIDTEIPLYDHDFEKLNHFLRVLVMKYTDFSDLNNLKNKILLTTYQLVKEFYWRKGGGKDFKKIYDFLTQEKFNRIFLIKHYNKEGKKFIEIYPNSIFYEGLIITDQRIMQNVSFDIFEKLKNTYKDISNKKSLGKRGHPEHLLLMIFNHVVRMNNQDALHTNFPLNLTWFKKRNCISPRLLRKREYCKIWKNIEDAFNSVKKHGLIHDFKISDTNAPKYLWEIVLKTKKIF